MLREAGKSLRELCEDDWIMRRFARLDRQSLPAKMVRL